MTIVHLFSPGLCQAHTHTYTLTHSLTHFGLKKRYLLRYLVSQRERERALTPTLDTNTILSTVYTATVTPVVLVLCVLSLLGEIPFLVLIYIYIIVIIFII